jgi:hypothetical protein
MIRREVKEGWILINQYDHARLSGEIMKYWGNEEFAIPNPYDEVLLAIREHDWGWKEWDYSPKVNPENQYPMNFMEMSFCDQNKIWTRCFKRHSVEHPYASALIALHFSKFNDKLINKDPCNGKAKALKTEMNDFVSDMLKINISNLDPSSLPKDVQVNLRLVQIGDVISLALCHGWSSIEIEDVPLDYNGRVVTLSLRSDDGNNYFINPYPLAGSLIRSQIKGRRVNQKKFASDDELRQKLNESEHETLHFSIQRG